MIDGGFQRSPGPQRAATDLDAAAARGLDGVIAAGVAVWDRVAMLPRLIPVGPAEIADDSRAGRLAILRRLSRALRGERVRGRAGHWSYSLDRHIGLVQAMAAERRRFAEVAEPAVAGEPLPASRASATAGRDRGPPKVARPGIDPSENETAADDVVRGGS